MGEEMPRELRNLIEAIGAGPAVRLVRRFQGQRLYVPELVGGNHPIARCIGLEATRRLQATYAGDCFEVPLAKSTDRVIRNAEIRRLYNAGEKASNLAQQFRMRLRSIRRILAEGGSRER